MTFSKHNSDLLPNSFRSVSRGKRFCGFYKLRFLQSVFLIATLFLTYFATFGINIFSQVAGDLDSNELLLREVKQETSKVIKLPPKHRKQFAGDLDSSELLLREIKQETPKVIKSPPKHRKQFAGDLDSSELLLGEGKQETPKVIKSPPKHRKQYRPCEIGFLDSVNDLVEPKDFMNFTQFSLDYIDKEDKHFGSNNFEHRFGGHQTLWEREKSFGATNQTLHCGFVKGPPGQSSTLFDLDEKDRAYMNSCVIVVSSCIFGSFDYLRRPDRRMISEYSKKNVCFVMFVDEQTLSSLSSDGNIPDDRGYMGLWRIVVVRNLPYKDMRKTGKVPKFLSHRLFPSSRYSIWLDSKMRLTADPMLIIEYFLWRTSSEYAISNHYERHCVWEEVLRNKRLNKYNHTAIDEQFTVYQSDGLTMFDPSDPNTPLPSYVPEGSFIIRAHTPMSNLFSCLWFNEVDRFTSRDQLSFAYTYLKLRRMNPDIHFHLNMFKDCERRAMAKLLKHRLLSPLSAT